MVATPDPAELVQGCYLVIQLQPARHVVDRFFDQRDAKALMKKLGGRRAGYRIGEDHAWPVPNPDRRDGGPCTVCTMTATLSNPWVKLWGWDNGGYAPSR